MLFVESQPAERTGPTSLQGQRAEGLGGDGGSDDGGGAGCRFLE